MSIYISISLIITKLIVVFMSKPGKLPSDLDYKVGNYHNKTKLIIK